MFDDKKISRLTLKNVIYIITYTVLLIWVVINIGAVYDTFNTLLNLIKPFIYGFALAYIFNLPMKFFLRKLPNSLGKFKKLCAVLLSIIIIGMIITFIFQIVVPQVVENISTLVNALPGYFNSAEKYITEIIESKQIPDNVIAEIMKYSKDIQDAVLNVAKNILPHILGFAGGFANSIANIFLSIVIAVYLSISKDKLIGQVKRLLYAFLPEKMNTHTLKVIRLSNKTFSAFIAGQMMEAVIIGVLCYIGCLIFGFPYAPIMGVIIGCTNIIPIFGPIIGTGVCAVLILFINPLQAVLFVVFGICLQQFESNLIYPRVVGTTVGLGGLWVLFAISVGGGLFGIMGMILGLPAFSIVYTLLREEVERRTKLKKASAQIQISET